ncbi:MAG: prepilin-type N-terminal cleavage/methylation domain-containing protein [Candidatus Gottesmanbacteria bacterium]
MFQKGFTLIEIIIVLAVIAILSVVGIESIIEFQKSALLGGVSDEFMAVLRSARTKSISGELLAGESPEKFSETGLPIYGVRTTASSYTLFRRYQLACPPTPCSPIQNSDLENESYSLDPHLTFSTIGEVLFDRITGVPITGSTTQFTLERVGSSDHSTLEINNEGVVKK